MISKSLQRGFVLALILPAAAFAWGPDGHRIVADIAARHLTPQAQAGVSRLLGSQTLTDVASWADEIRKDRHYRWSANLHYVNLQSGAAAFDWQRDCPSGKCVVGAVVRFTRVLRDPAASDAQRTEALKFLVHFVGDVHQPMHVSREDDRGGNSIAVKFFNKPANLHEVWDIFILQHTGKPWQTCARELDARITDEQRSTWAKLDPAIWATESWKLANSNGYAIPKDGQLGSEYYETNLPVVEQRLQTAGIRLATLLNAIFGNGEGLSAMDIPAASRPTTSSTEPSSLPAN